VLFTRGRTGDPKGALLTHRNLAAAASSLAKSFDLNSRDRLLCAFGLDRAVGHSFGLWAPLSVGAAIIADDRPPDKIGRLCRSESCTVLSISPQTLESFSTCAQPDDLTSLRLIVCSGAKLDAGDVAEFEQRFQVKPLSAYDCTEMAAIVATNLPD